MSFPNAIPWYLRPEQELRVELNSRGLPCTGVKPVLCQRLDWADEQLNRPRGCRIAHERRLKVALEAKIAQIIPFLKFSLLPPEIRTIIWEMALPGPRTISPCSNYCMEECPYDHRQTKDRETRVESHEREDITILRFHKKRQAPNPAHLSTCRESRVVALKRYRLVFDTPNIYADLSIDILFIGPYGPQWKPLLSGDEIFWQPAPPIIAEDTLRFYASEWARKYLRERLRSVSLRPCIVADLEQVQNLALTYEGWLGNGDGEKLRENLRIFKGLKRLLLSVDPYDGGIQSCTGLPGQISFLHQGEVEDIERWSQIVRGRHYEDDYRTRTARVLSDFRTKNLRAKEEQGLPEIKLVLIKRAFDIPEALVLPPGLRSHHPFYSRMTL